MGNLISSVNPGKPLQPVRVPNQLSRISQPSQLPLELFSY